MQKIGFIFPSSDYLHDPFRGDPHTHFQILTVLDDRLGNKVDTSLIDLRGIKRKFAHYVIPEQDVFLHSTYTLDWEEQKEIVEGIRDRYPNAKHIAGGPHTSCFQKESKQVFDSIILGDGEESIVQAINDNEKNELQQIYEQQGKIDVKEYPFPRRHYLPHATIARKGLVSRRDNKELENLLSTTVIFSRGCTDKCAFCAMPGIKKYNPGIRFRDPESIEAELEYLKSDFGIQAVSLLDEIGFPPRFDKAQPYIEAIGRTQIPWKGQCRVDNVTKDVAALLADSGCEVMCLGVESVYQNSLDLIKKRIQVEQSKQAIKLLNKQGIETRVYMIIGLPGEDNKVVEKTWDFIKETNPASVYLSLFTARPGTDVFNNPQNYGIKNIDSDWSKTMHIYGRYEHERPRLTFEYEDNPFWGKAMKSEEIVDKYLELQQKVIDNGYGPV
ncbi:radical SAM protein [Candidatus Pacearchaeota archaeon]|nr:radical SAM protein [Candidatus Pacearchaeota archaeon]